jgi:hypothetical protein
MMASSCTKRVRTVEGRNYSLTVHVDGSYTVSGDGLQPITFSKGTNHETV